MTEQHKQPDMIEMPEAWKKDLSEAEVRTVGRTVVTREYGTGKYGNGIVVLDRPEGIPLEVSGLDAHTMQARTLNVNDRRERSSSLTQEEIEEV
ncbi:MAG: hypothetical protein WBK76_02315 [Candidatus Saccharimonadales bacterium]